MDHDKPGHLILRADAGPQIGTGHVMRCLSLAQAWIRAGGEATLATAICPPDLANRAKNQRVDVVDIGADRGGAQDARALSTLAEEKTAQWVVLDGYDLGPEHQRQVMNPGGLLVVDDFGFTGVGEVDIVVDQNLAASETLYRGQGYKGKLLVGPRYAILRDRFRELARKPPPIPDCGKTLLITLGGSDPDNASRIALEGAIEADVPDMEIRVIMGASYEHAATLESLADHDAVHLERDVDDMAARMAEADLAIAAGGTTSWELAALGLPALQIILSEDQEPNVEALDDSGAVRNLGWASELDPSTVAEATANLSRDVDARRAMSKEGRRIVDARGGDRVVAAMRSLGGHP